MKPSWPLPAPVSRAPSTSPTFARFAPLLYEADNTYQKNQMNIHRAFVTPWDVARGCYLLSARRTWKTSINGVVLFFEFGWRIFSGETFLKSLNISKECRKNIRGRFRDRFPSWTFFKVSGKIGVVGEQRLDTGMVRLGAPLSAMLAAFLTRVDVNAHPRKVNQRPSEKQPVKIRCPGWNGDLKVLPSALLAAIFTPPAVGNSG